MAKANWVIFEEMKLEWEQQDQKADNAKRALWNTFEVSSSRAVEPDWPWKDGPSYRPKLVARIV